MNKGFTLIEVIIVICIFLLLGAIFWPVGANYYRQQVLDKSEQQIVWILKQARANAINQENNAAFGVYLNQGALILFEGTMFSQRNQEADIVYHLAPNITLSGEKEFVFLPNTGEVEIPGKIMISLNAMNKEISVNKLGVIDY
ncbi:MAG: type II secretion system protein [Candidatus Parcubacteria bacterium]|nr:type II secretion system protein [Candidatus Parcubacteria bacterium]